MIARLAGFDVPIPLLVIHLPALERTAWREGLRKARALERRATLAFATAAGRVLRASDLIAHDAGNDRFLAALSAPQRALDDTSAIDVRSALARISAVVEAAVHLDVRTGWTMFVPDDRANVESAIDRALARGAQERERYAFFSAIGHELRTPLSSIRGYLETLLDGGIDRATRERFVSVAHAEALRLSRLVDGMFEISLLDLEHIGGRRRVCELSSALGGALAAVSVKASARSVRIESALDEVLVAMDADSLTLVLINVIENAIKHGSPGGSVRVQSSSPRAAIVRIDVDDNGPGIAAADRERIFALGERGATSAAGSGIGLAFVRLLIERAAGTITVAESPLGGARFRLELPAAVR